MPSIRTIVSFLISILLCDIFIATQHFYIPEKIRPLAAFIFVVLAFTLYFFMASPESLFSHAKWLSLACGLFACAIIVVQDIVIRKMFSYKFVFIIVVAFVSPLAGAWIYGMIKRR
ncbi:MAG TPA: hypothetical protein VF857_08040, partial [Spirochaetota bacterium]